MKSDVFAVVMATGIVSIAAAEHGLDAVSVVLAALAMVALPVLAYLTAAGWRRNGWNSGDLDTAIGLLTYVAASAVLSARFDEHRVVVYVLGALALQGWLALMPLVVRDMWRQGWIGLRARAHGAWELVSVATSGLAIVFAAAQIMFWALIFWCLALLLYLAMTVLICWRIASDPAMRRDVPPDHWILMGGLAVATLAGDHVYDGLFPGPTADAIRGVTVVTWVLATLWIVPLACVGWRRIRAWPAVFPLGMYSSATYAVFTETGWHALTTVSLTFFWIALTVWILTAVRWRTIFRRVPVAGTP